MGRKFILLSIFTILLFQFGSSQSTDSCHLRISVLTCSPGDELYSLFGHSAIRIVDSTKRTDSIYNWGTFDFDEPNFYFKFMRGKLLYFVSSDLLPDFLGEYQYEDRSVIEQVLNLTCDEKNRIKYAVDSNMFGDNRFYRYDFAYDNCTTRIRDLVFNNIAGVNISSHVVPKGTTLRSMIHSYLDKGGQPWSKLGIDILLGAKIDKPVTNHQAMFLPEYLMKAIDSAKANNQSIVKTENIILPAHSDRDISGVYTTFIAMTILCAILFIISIIKRSWAIAITRMADSFVLYITGVIGILLVFMWFFTDHIACADNYNLLWAIPFNAAAGFVVWKKPLWIKKYFFVLAVETALVLICWHWLPQQLNIAIIPVMLFLLYRYIRLATAYNVPAQTLKKFRTYGQKTSI